MPMDRSRYPDNWEQISQDIRFGRANARLKQQRESGQMDMFT